VRQTTPSKPLSIEMPDGLWVCNGTQKMMQQQLPTSKNYSTALLQVVAKAIVPLKKSRERIN
jgi:hypothetical protein